MVIRVRDGTLSDWRGELRILVPRFLALRTHFFNETSALTLLNFSEESGVIVDWTSITFF